jgi:uncharacterized protein YxjI
MRYKMKQNIWSWGDNFTIQDEQDRDVYQVKGKVFSFGDKLHLLDMQGQELAFISQRLMTFKPRYEIYRGGNLFAEVVKEFSWFKSKFTLDVPGPNDYTITGEFWRHEYHFERGGRQVALISKQFWAMRDIYGIDIVDGEDDIAILATCVVIDMVLHDDSGSSSGD